MRNQHIAHIDGEAMKYEEKFREGNNFISTSFGPGGIYPVRFSDDDIRRFDDLLKVMHPCVHSILNTIQNS